MKIVKPSYEILTPIDREYVLKLIESAGRVCYKSEDKICDGSAGPFVDKLCHVNKHHSIIEHFSFSVRFITDRAVSHEAVRHRLASYSQSSQRYVDYSKEKHGKCISFIEPPFPANTAFTSFQIWVELCRAAEKSYFDLLDEGCSPQIARSVLPNCTMTELIMTANLREWKHIFELRCSEHAHPQMRELMIPLRDEVKAILPEIF